MGLYKYLLITGVASKIAPVFHDVKCNCVAVRFDDGWNADRYLCVGCGFELPQFFVMFLVQVRLNFCNFLCQLFPPFLVSFGDCIFHALDFS